tara:strand:- start:74577 stop:75893 length:1317 start_codon:yes stop_codon:yes gene_type:complete
MLPFVLVLKKKYEILSCWLALICMVDIFNSQAYLNLSALKLTSIALIPFYIRELSSLFKIKQFRIIFYSFCYLLILALYFSFVSPWVDETDFRPKKDLPPIRPILHLASNILEFMAFVYFGKLASANKKLVSIFFKSVIASGLVLSISVLLELIFQFDFYHFFTSGTKLKFMSGRPRGFSYEPRGLAQSTGFALLITIMYWKDIKTQLKTLITITCFYLGFILPASATAVISLCWGLALILTIRLVTRRKIEIKTKQILQFLLCTAVIVVSTFLLPEKTVNTISSHFKERYTSLSSGSILSRLEDQESSAMNFLIENPAYLITGVGPGMIYIPGVDHREARFAESNPFTKSSPFNVLPHMGLILLLSNGGLIYLSLFAYLLTTSWKYLKQKPRSIELVVLLFGLYLLQVRIPYLFFLSIVMMHSYNRGANHKLNRELT